MFNKSTFALAAVAGVFANALMMMQPLRADDFLGGGGGGNFGQVNCPAGRVMVGLTGRSGVVIDTMQIVCGINSNPDDVIFVPAKSIGPSAGGGPTGAICNKFDAVTSIEVRAKEFQGNVVVSQIILHCSAMLDGSFGGQKVFGGGGGDDAGSQPCNPNEYVAGITGRSGSFIDAIAISICRRRSAIR